MIFYCFIIIIKKLKLWNIKKHCNSLIIHQPVTPRDGFDTRQYAEQTPQYAERTQKDYHKPS